MTDFRLALLDLLRKDEQGTTPGIVERSRLNVSRPSPA